MDEMFQEPAGPSVAEPTLPPAETCEGAERALGWLAGAGLRPTRQRVALAELLVGDGRDRHVTAESLFDASARAGVSVSLATVYNTLRCFTQAGLLSEIAVEGPRSYFDTRTERHAHFYWEDHATLTDAPADTIAFARVPEPPEGTEICGIDVVVRVRRKR